MWIFVCEYVGFYVVECCVGFVFDVVVECLNDVFFEMWCVWMCVYDCFLFGIVVFWVSEVQYVYFDVCCDQCDNWMYVLWDVGCGVQCD